MTRAARAFAHVVSFLGVGVLLFLSFCTSPSVAYTGVLLFASGRAINIALAGED
jgi:hypothetical protein